MILTNYAFTNFRQRKTTSRKEVLKKELAQEQTQKASAEKNNSGAQQVKQSSGNNTVKIQNFDFFNLDKIYEGTEFKEDLVAMGFTEEEISKYFKPVWLTPIGVNGPKNQRLQLRTNIEINGRAVNNIQDLKYELFQAPLDNLYNKVRAGVVNQDELVDELHKLGAVNISQVERTETNEIEITFTFRGETQTIFPKNLTIVEAPAEKYDENGEKIERSQNYMGYSRKDLIRNFNFKDSDIAQYFVKHNINEETMPSKEEDFDGWFAYNIGKKTADNDGIYYTLREDIVINGFEVKNISELWYYLVIAPLKAEN